MIEVKNVEKSFGEQKVLKGITTTFETGKTNLIIGQIVVPERRFCLRVCSEYTVLTQELFLSTAVFTLK